tara:strand:+ start:135 stop:353 length:219 start_codon:yes stop_codon:yes gene_type:complete
MIRLSEKKYIVADEKGTHLLVLRVRAFLCKLLSNITGIKKPYKLRTLCWKYFGIPFIKYPKDYSKDFRKEKC